MLASDQTSILEAGAALQQFVAATGKQAKKRGLQTSPSLSNAAQSERLQESGAAATARETRKALPKRQQRRLGEPTQR